MLKKVEEDLEKSIKAIYPFLFDTHINLRISKEHVRVNEHNSHARQYGTTDSLTLAEWIQTIAEFNALCAYCRKRKFSELEHFLPIEQEGTHAGNCVPACRTCNRKKGNRIGYGLIVKFGRQTVDKIQTYLAARADRQVLMLSMPRPFPLKGLEQEVIQYYQEGHTKVQTAKHFGCSDTSIRVILARRKITERGLTEEERKRTDTQGRLIERCEVDLNTGCWLWTGAIKGDGYGSMRIGKKTYSVSRVSASLFLGLDLADSKTLVLHRCDIPRCFNPDHLFLGTTTDNNRDTVAKGRHKIWSKKLTDDDIGEARSMLLQGFSYIEICQKFGISRTTVRRIKNGVEGRYAYQKEKPP